MHEGQTHSMLRALQLRRMLALQPLALGCKAALLALELHKVCRLSSLKLLFLHCMCKNLAGASGTVVLRNLCVPKLHMMLVHGCPAW